MFEFFFSILADLVHDKLTMKQYSLNDSCLFLIFSRNRTHVFHILLKSLFNFRLDKGANYYYYKLYINTVWLNQNKIWIHKNSGSLELC